MTSWRVLHIVSRATGACLAFLCLTPASAWALTTHQTETLMLIEREWRYLSDRCEETTQVLGELPRLAEILEEARGIQERSEASDEALLSDRRELAERLGSLSAEVNRIAAPGGEFAATFVEPYERFSPTYVPAAEPAETFRIVALPGEYHAAAIALTNCTDRSARYKIDLQGLRGRHFDVDIRQHVFVGDWYYKGKKRLADPLTLLPRRGETWEVSVPAGQTVKLHIGIRVGVRARGSHRASVSITTRAGERAEMNLRVQILPAPPPTDSPFEHLAFIYPNSSFAGKFPELAGEDLGAHGVTMMEFPHMPPASFSADGELLEADFSTHERWLLAYGPHVRRMMIFWWSDLTAEDGTEWELLTPPWRRAFVNLLRAWFARAAELGYGMDRFVILPRDEAHSSTLAASPDESIAVTTETMAFLKSEIPDLPAIMTLSYYAYPADVRAMLPHLDIAVVIHPYIEQLAAKYAPADYSPRQAWIDEISPMLRERHADSQMTMLSYHVATGRSDSVLHYNYAYPILMVGQGIDGVSHWAYNNVRGSSWHAWDDGWLDYLFVYDGSEDHRTARRYNPTGEKLVPSVRWESLRAGIQTAKLLLSLREAAEDGTLTGPQAAQVIQLLNEARERYEGQEDLTSAWVSDTGDRARLVYSDAAR